MKNGLYCGNCANQDTPACEQCDMASCYEEAEPDPRERESDRTDTFQLLCVLAVILTLDLIAAGLTAVMLTGLGLVPSGHYWLTAAVAYGLILSAEAVAVIVAGRD